MARFGQSFIQGLTNPAYMQGMFNLGQTVGAAPGKAIEEQKQSKAMELVNQAMMSNDPQQMLQAAQAVRSFDAPTSLKLSELAQQTTVKQKESQQLTERQESLATLAESLGLPELAREARTTTDLVALRDIGKDIRQIQISKIPTQSPGVRRSLAVNAGITPQQFETMGLAKVSNEDFNATIAGQKGDVKSWMTESGDIAAFRENEFGMVYDDERAKFVPPSSLGLKQAPPQVQKVEQLTTGMADELAKVGAKSFVELGDGAQKAQETLVSINRSVGDIDNMFTGTGANLKLQVSKATRAFGIDVVDPSTIADTEVYIATSAERVADYITNLGAGTGLSDKDLEFAKKVVGGEITADAVSLKRMLKNLKEGANRKISTYLDTRTRLEKELGANKGVLSYFPNISMPTQEGTDQTVQWSDLQLWT